MNKFYILKPEEGIRFGRKWAYADLIPPINRGDNQYCPVCSGVVSGLRWLPPHRIKLSSAKPSKWGDFVWGAGFPLLVSSKFKAVYEQEGLSGIEDFSSSVEVVRMGTLKSGLYPVHPPTYHLIHVPWGDANQDDTASGLIHEQPGEIDCAFCRVGVTWRKQERIVIEKSSWDGSDIFKPRNAPVSFMVTERFKQVAENNALTNIWCIAADRYAYDERRPGLWYVKD